eukprot:CAMPEP_0206580390 /NCGR_PEP_ID=MMETSP0325_2-20121206/33131_1 /ASSEMBLY_ACC=CAM_ASM_000347 /TAXON_ID=2866 /ORGANISM="Crypthecodinium cohnii, Strain Seligo" /LENGTH=345 /DNA_ID=CAMNT_0054086413 /DNA_START=13 /DNA_END=1047 /DNA_ORIENTATION=+
MTFQDENTWPEKIKAKLRFGKGGRAQLLSALQRGESGAFADADPCWKRDREVVLFAVEQNGTDLQWVDGSIRSDPEVLLAAIRQDWKALAFASLTAKCDSDLVMEAILQNPAALDFADASLKRDKQIVLAAVERDGFSLRFADLTLRRDPEVVLVASKQNSESFRWADATLQSNRSLILAAIQSHGSAMRYALGPARFDKYILFESLRGGHELNDMYHDQRKVLEGALVAAGAGPGLSSSEARSVPFAVEGSRHDSTSIILTEMFPEPKGETLYVSARSCRDGRQVRTRISIQAQINDLGSVLRALLDPKDQVVMPYIHLYKMDGTKVDLFDSWRAIETLRGGAW